MELGLILINMIRNGTKFFPAVRYGVKEVAGYLLPKDQSRKTKSGIDGA